MEFRFTFRFDISTAQFLANYLFTDAVYSFYGAPVT